jgi:DNA replication protein DnaC
MEHFSEEEMAMRMKLNTLDASFTKLLQQRGKRYANCKMENYNCKCEAQTAAVSRLIEYAEDSKRRVSEGQNVILFGPRGSGKDHLLMGLARLVATHSMSCVTWANGVDLLEEFRAEAMGQIQRYLFGDQDNYETCDVLWISDPLPPSGALTESQQKYMFQLLDARYSAMRPTWITVNCASGAELEARMGAQSADRLRHDALAIHCDWPSYRTGE